MQKDQKTLDILSIGEALIDFTPDGRHGVYIRNFGGAPANLALVAARMGAKVGFAGTVGRDAFGEFLIRKLQDEGVDTQGVCCTDEACTTLAFLSSLSENLGLICCWKLRILRRCSKLVHGSCTLEAPR